MIPLHDLGCTIDQISDIVDLGDIDGNENEISTIQEIIDFYQNIKSTHSKKESLDEKMMKAMVDLQDGQFLPGSTIQYYKGAKYWVHSDYLRKANKNGLLSG